MNDDGTHLQGFTSKTAIQMQHGWATRTIARPMNSRHVLDTDNAHDLEEEPSGISIDTRLFDRYILPSTKADLTDQQTMYTNSSFL